jgi:hypothetical protein
VLGKHRRDVEAERVGDGQCRGNGRPRASVLQTIHVRAIESGGGRELRIPAIVITAIGAS